MELNIAGLIPVVGVGVIRSAAGWLEKALHEKSHGGTKVTKFEIAQLGGTVVRVGLFAIAGFYTINGIFGTDISVFTASAGAFVTDFVLKKLK